MHMMLYMVSLDYVGMIVCNESVHEINYLKLVFTGKEFASSGP